MVRIDEFWLDFALLGVQSLKKDMKAYRIQGKGADFDQKIVSVDGGDGDCERFDLSRVASSSDAKSLHRHFCVSWSVAKRMGSVRG